MSEEQLKTGVTLESEEDNEGVRRKLVTSIHITPKTKVLQGLLA